MKTRLLKLSSFFRFWSNIRILFIVVFFTCVYSGNTFAQAFQEKRIPVYIYGGATFADIKTKAVFEDRNSVINSELNLEDDLGFSSRTIFPFFRITPGGRFQVSGSFASLHRKGEGDLTRQFSFGDSVYTIGTHIKGYLNTDYFSLRLQYSVIHTLKFNASVSLGLGYSKFKAGIEAFSYGLTYKKDAAENLPILLPGVHLNFYLLPNTLVRTSIDLLSIKINDSKEKISAAQISIEQYLFKFLGAGVGYSINTIHVKNLPENDAFLRDIEFEAKGFSFFAALRF